MNDEINFYKKSKCQNAKHRVIIYNIVIYLCFNTSRFLSNLTKPIDKEKRINIIQKLNTLLGSSVDTPR